MSNEDDDNYWTRVSATFAAGVSKSWDDMRTLPRKKKEEAKDK